MPFVVLCKPFVSARLYFVNVVDVIAVMMNDHGIYEHILEDDIFFGVVGMLECTLCYLRALYDFDLAT